MKKILAFLALGLLLGACSGKLSSSKAEDLVKESLKEKPMYRYITIYTGEIKIDDLSEEEYKRYEKLQGDGYLKISVIEKPVLDWARKPIEGKFKKFYSISLTEKSKDYLFETKESYSKGAYDAYENPNSEGAYENTMRTYTAEVDKVSNIHIIPEMNVADADATFVKKDKTPFFIFDDQTDSFTEGVKFQKTEDKGWQVYR